MTIDGAGRLAPFESLAVRPMNMISIRPAAEFDVEPICSFDRVAQRNSERREFVREEVLAGNCLVATFHEVVIAYGVLDYTFYRQGCIEMLYVHPEHRRRGAGSALLVHIESICKTSKLFTSTNRSNMPMQSLLAKHGYVQSGVIHHLDEYDPEIVYFKRLADR